MRGGSRRTGFSLLEVLIALAIFSIGTLALIPLFGMASDAARRGRNLTEATALARTYLDKVRNTPYGTIGPCDPVNLADAGATLPNCTPPADEVPPPYTVVWTVTAANGTAYPYGGTANPDMKRITVTVTRPCVACPNGQVRVQMTTLISARS